MKLASRFKRFLSVFIDSFILSFIVIMVFGVIFALSNTTSVEEFSEYLSRNKIIVIAVATIGAVYTSLFESSKLQATPGQLLFNIYVATTDNKKITFLQALQRYILYCLPNILITLFPLQILFNNEGVVDKIVDDSFFDISPLFSYGDIFIILFTLWWFLPIFSKKRQGLYEKFSNTQIFSRK